MALRYGSKNGSALRYDPYSAVALRYGSKNAWTSGNGEYDEGATPAEYFIFRAINSEWTISAASKNDMPSEVIIPRVYQGLPVTTICGWAFDCCKSIVRVIIPDSVTTIGDAAFQDCSSLIDIVIPASVTTIGMNSFYGCSNLTIFCEAESKPDGWDNAWASGVGTVNWGYTG